MAGGINGDDRGSMGLNGVQWDQWGSMGSMGINGDSMGVYGSRSQKIFLLPIWGFLHYPFIHFTNLLIVSEMIHLSMLQIY